MDKTVTENVQAVAEALDKEVWDVTVVVLDRPRHQGIIDELRRCGARIRLISDGDVSPAVATGIEDSGVDLMIGIGGAPEGVLAAAALRSIGGEFMGRLCPENEAERSRAAEMLGAIPGGFDHGGFGTYRGCDLCSQRRHRRGAFKRSAL